MSDEHGDLWDEISLALMSGLSVTISPVRDRYGKYARISVFDSQGNRRTQRMHFVARDEFPEATEAYWEGFGESAAAMVRRLMDDDLPMRYSGALPRYEE